jgi:hypothetical protein
MFKVFLLIVLKETTLMSSFLFFMAINICNTGFLTDKFAIFLCNIRIRLLLPIDDKEQISAN